MKSIKRMIWQWPDGLVWKLTNRQTLESRRKKYDLFLSLAKPRPEFRILDVGVAPYTCRGTNFLEQWYPFPEKIIALANPREDDFKGFLSHFPKIKLVFGDGTRLGFLDNAFDIVFSNAVVEHVGSRDKQKKFIREICRVGRKIFISTPNYWFPVDAHTLLPFAHFLPQRPRFWVYRMAARGYWAHPERLNLLSVEALISLFPETVRLQIYRQKTFGLTTNLIVLAEKK